MVLKSGKPSVKGLHLVRVFVLICPMAEGIRVRQREGKGLNSPCYSETLLG
jgi:hypothetical protein